MKACVALLLVLASCGDKKPSAVSPPLPALAADEILLLAGARGDNVVLTAPDGKRVELRDGAIAKTTGDDRALPGGLTYAPDDLAEIQPDLAAAVPHAAQVVTRAQSSGDFNHADVWFVPTVATRAQLGNGSSMIAVDWSDPQHRWAVVILDEHGAVVDVKTAIAKPLGDSVGSPSYAPDGTLYYRTLDGGAWKWTGDVGQKIGKGKAGKAQTGDLNSGIEPAKYPAAVTFDHTGKPAFR